MTDVEADRDNRQREAQIDGAVLHELLHYNSSEVNTSFNLHLETQGGISPSAKLYSFTQTSIKNEQVGNSFCSSLSAKNAISTLSKKPWLLKTCWPLSFTVS